MVTAPEGSPQVAATRPPMSATGRKMPLVVTTDRWLPVMGAREAQPRSSGSKGPSNRGEGRRAKRF